MFTEDAEARKLIHEIAVRAIGLGAGIGRPQGFLNNPLLETEMDLAACHCSNPLRLGDLLAADNFNLMHDVMGIARHLNRKTGKLENHFSPRFSKRGK